MSRPTIRERRALVLLGWQAECAVADRATHLVNSFTPPSVKDGLPESIADCVELGRNCLRAHLRMGRGGAV